MIDVVRVSDGSQLKDGRVILVWRDSEARYGGGGHTSSDGYDWLYAVGPDADEVDVSLAIERAARRAIKCGVDTVYVDT